MQKALKIVVADDDRLVLRIVRHHLEQLGHRIVTEACSGGELIEAVNEYHPDIVITDINMQGLDGLAAIETFSKHHQSAIIVISGYSDPSTLERVSLCPVQAFIPKPIDFASLSAAIAIAIQRFAEFQRVQNEADSAKRRLAERALVEKAKGVLMKRAMINEDNAYKKMREMARKGRQTLGQVASSLLLTEEALLDLEVKSTPF